MRTFQPTGPTTFVSGNTAGVTGNVAINAGGQGGPITFKIDNINNANVDAFINYSVNSNVAATIANATATGNSVPVQHNDTLYLQTGGDFTPPAQVYFAVITSTGVANCYITPGIIR